MNNSLLPGVSQNADRYASDRNLPYSTDALVVVCDEGAGRSGLVGGSLCRITAVRASIRCKTRATTSPLVRLL